MTVPGSVAAADSALRELRRCGEPTCVRGQPCPADSAQRALTRRVTGRGLTRRILVVESSWWRLPDGGVVLDMIGADHVNAQFPGTRVGCLRERWTLATRSGGMVAVTRQLVMDPLPPFGLTSLVARATAQRALTSLDDLAAVLQMTAQSSNSVAGALPWRTTPLPQLCASFVRCQNAAAPRA